MIIYLRYATDSQTRKLPPFVDSGDGDSEETGLTIANTDILIGKPGGTTLTAKHSGGATHISNGIYYATFDSSDSDTVGNGELYVHKSGALFAFATLVILPAKVYDSLFLGTDNLEVDVIQLLGTAWLTPAVAGTPDVTAKTVSDKTGYTASVSDKTGFSLSADGILAIWHQAVSGIVTASTIGKLIKDNLDAAISTRSSHSAADVWSSATRSLTEKTGFSLSQTFPTNFSSMAISALGKLTVGTNDDKTGYTASVSDKTGFSLSTAGILDIWHQLLASIATAGSIGKLIKDNLDAKVSEVGGGSLTAADIADAVLDEAASGHTGVIATNLDAAVSTRSTYAGTPPTVEQIRAEMDSNSTKLASINNKTQALPAIWGSP